MAQVSAPMVALEDVAAIYTAAVASGDPPTKAVAWTLGISPGAAAQRVLRARRAGLLPAVTPGVAAGNVPRGWLPL